MSDTVKLIIEIPEDTYAECRGHIYFPDTGGELFDAVKDGILLDDVKAEIKAMFPPSGNWMYDEECEHEHTVCEVLVDVLQILDNIGRK